MLYVFDDVNVAKGLYDGIDGFERAKNKMLEYQKGYNELPIISHPEMVAISNAISRGNFKQFNINRWNDMMRSVLMLIQEDIMEKKDLKLRNMNLRNFTS